MTSETRECVWRRLKDPIGTVFRLFWTLDRDPKTAPIIEELVRLRDQILGMPDRDYVKYKDEIAFLSSAPYDYLVQSAFPYPRIKKGLPFESGFDKKIGLPYVVHKGHPLFFTEKHTVADAENEYKRLTEEEGLLGSGCLAKSPHRYQTAEFHVDPTDVLIDIGSAEGLFALDNAATAMRIIVFECLPEWEKPLMNTFAPFGDKVIIINKRVSDRTYKHCIRLVDAISETKPCSYFLKMDIEGAERMVINSSRDFLTKNKVKMSCCAYHRPDDETILFETLSKLGFTVHFSDGYMVLQMHGSHYPYFRRGMVYAKNY